MYQKSFYLWHPCKPIHTNFIPDAALRNVNTNILITYETMCGRRYVTKVQCEYGRVRNKFKGEIVAWCELPQPYKGE